MLHLKRRTLRLRKIRPCLTLVQFPQSRYFRMRDEATYICDNCGEEIVIPVDVAAGQSQSYVEDCPVCCHPQLIHIELDDDGDSDAWGEAE
jgi:hypothetical protein